MFKNFFKQLLCKHVDHFVRNIYGDEIIHVGGKRSLWCCRKCGKYTYKDELKSL